MTLAVLRLIRLTDFNDLFLHYVKIAAIVGASAIAAISRVDMMLLLLIVFSVSAEIFAFVVNDLSDAKLDMLNTNTRNPLARGEMTNKAAAFIAIVFLAISIFLLMLLPSRIVPFGMAGLFLSLTYSWGVRAKFKPPIDVVYHGSMFALPFLMGYLLYRPLDENCLLGSFSICIVGAVAELMQEIRDHDVDTAWGKTTATVLGKKKSLTLCLLLMIILGLLSFIIVDRTLSFSFNIWGSSVPFQLVALPLLSLLLMKPLISGIVTNAGQQLVYDRFRKRALVISVIVLCSSVAVVVYGCENSVDVAVSATNYSFDLAARTIVAGREGSDVPWILFDYVDQDNFYYLILHKNGILELGQTVNAKYEGYIASINTGLSPFQTNQFHVSANGTTIQVTLDKQYHLTAPRIQRDSPFRIRVQSVERTYVGNLRLTNLLQHII